MRLIEFAKTSTKPKIKDVPLETSGLGSYIERLARSDGIKGVHLANFLAHCKVETAGFTSLTEWGSGKQYEGNKDLGNIYSGDGVLFKGRGFLHLTGRENYTRASRELYGDDRLVKNPNLVATNTKVAGDTALWFWNKFIRPNYKAADVAGVTKRLNGPGMHGLTQRTAAFTGYLIKMGLRTNPVKKAELDGQPADTAVAQNAIDQLPADDIGMAERGKASRSLCVSSKPDDELGASQLASCKSQGLRARDGEKSHLIGHRGSKVRVTVGGKKIKGKKYGGPLPDYGTRKNQL